MFCLKNDLNNSLIIKTVAYWFSVDQLIVSALKATQNVEGLLPTLSRWLIQACLEPPWRIPGPPCHCSLLSRLYGAQVNTLITRWGKKLITTWSRSHSSLHVQDSAEPTTSAWMQTLREADESKPRQTKTRFLIEATECGSVNKHHAVMCPTSEKKGSIFHISCC